MPPPLMMSSDVHKLDYRPVEILAGLVSLAVGIIAIQATTRFDFIADFFDRHFMDRSAIEAGRRFNVDG